MIYCDIVFWCKYCTSIVIYHNIRSDRLRYIVIYHSTLWFKLRHMDVQTCGEMRGKPRHMEYDIWTYRVYIYLHIIHILQIYIYIHNYITIFWFQLYPHVNILIFELHREAWPPEAKMGWDHIEAKSSLVAMVVAICSEWPLNQIHNGR